MRAAFFPGASCNNWTGVAVRHCHSRLLWPRDPCSHVSAPRPPRDFFPGQEKRKRRRRLKPQIGPSRKLRYLAIHVIFFYSFSLALPCPCVKVSKCRSAFCVPGRDRSAKVSLISQASRGSGVYRFVGMSSPYDLITRRFEFTILFPLQRELSTKYNPSFWARCQKRVSDGMSGCMMHDAGCI